jgi:hypothetical protein
MNDVDITKLETCRVLLIGSRKLQIAKVVEVMETSRKVAATTGDQRVRIEFLPCVARFDAYIDDQDKAVRYLSSVEYYGVDGMSTRPESLAPFFDGHWASEESDKSFGSIAGAALGSGLEEPADIEQITKFLNTMSKRPIPIECIRPNPDFATMTQELDYFRALGADAKAEATRLQTLGPGKMAKFSLNFANALIASVMKARRRELEAEVASFQHSATPDQPELAVVDFSNTIEPTRNRYSCRKCRRLLFGEKDLQDPQHLPAKHQFSARKMTHSKQVSASCQSFFLQGGLSWMTNVNETVEGKFGCPKCDTKIGTWNWSGAQCSCGTWVVPAIQVPRSKVDLVPPQTTLSTLPVGTIVSPHISLNTNASVSLDGTVK